MLVLLLLSQSQLDTLINKLHWSHDICLISYFLPEALINGIAKFLFYRYLSVIIKAVQVWLLGELTPKLIHMLS